VFNDIYKLPLDFKVYSLSYYQKGLLYGIDLSSATVVRVLNVQPADRVLDLCCCPGAKLMYIADLIKLMRLEPTKSTTALPKVL
jgi:16S rRNA C967 or C1407 C5-methylase (RsmB/RsmF family)